MAKRSSKVNGGGVWNFFGGRIDSKENPRAALIRELSEEAGLSIKPKKLIKTFGSHKKFIQKKCQAA